jgi:nuclear pore complex protein Nup205
MESISRLRAVLLNSFGPRGSLQGEQELFDELMMHKTRLLHLFDVGPRNAQERSDIESGN